MDDPEFGFEQWFDVFREVRSASFLLLNLLVMLVALVRFRRTFWGKLLAVGSGLRLLFMACWYCEPLTVYLFYTESYPPEPWSWNLFWRGIYVAFDWYSGLLVPLAIMSAPFVRRVGQPTETRPAAGYPGTKSSAIVTIILLLVTVNIYWLFWLHRTVKEIRQFAPDLLKVTPGRAVFYLFVPFFNVFWTLYIFAVLPRAVGRLNERYPAPACHSGYANLAITLFAIAAFAFNLLGGFHFPFAIIGELLLLTVFAYTQHYLNRIWDRVAHQQSAVAAVQT